MTSPSVHPLQQIFYGAPGTGKSYAIDHDPAVEEAKRDRRIFRTTFHPDSDYAAFVGAYKPAMQDGRIVYAFCEQIFLKAYVRAWQEWARAAEEVRAAEEARSAGNNYAEKMLAAARLNFPDVEIGKVAAAARPVFLIIEEINRGNCAQIFGDLFQLLDRRDDGFSDYPIVADDDLRQRLAEDFKGPDFAALDAAGFGDVRAGRQLLLPSNLRIWATMNTSDQSLFPIDGAFKRRWDWRYVPIVQPDAIRSDGRPFIPRRIQVGDRFHDWWAFLVRANEQIARVLESADKQLGYFFVKASDETGVINAATFVNKVLFYLYKDAFKGYEPPTELFGKAGDPKGGRYAFTDFFHAQTEQVGDVVRRAGDVNEETLAAFLAGLKVETSPEEASDAVNAAREAVESDAAGAAREA